MKIINNILKFLFLAFLVYFFNYSVTLAQINKEAEVITESGNLVTKIAPGDFLPMSVKLLNFGSGKKIDVQIEYKVLDLDDKVMVTQSETVAVETTASFVKFIQIPNDLKPGRYKAWSSILYESQKVPAISSFQFSVQNKYIGLFLNQLVLLGIVLLVLSLVFIYFGSSLRRKNNFGHQASHEYSNIPEKERIFYEIISDIITDMHYSVGNQALDLIEKIDGLKIDRGTGKVLSISKDPSEVISVLMIRYQNTFGKKLKLSNRLNNKDVNEQLVSQEGSVEKFEKFFINNK